MFKEELAGVTTNFEPVDRFENMRDMRGFVNVDSSTSKIILSIQETVCLRLRKIEVKDAAVKFIANNEVKSMPSKIHTQVRLQVQVRIRVPQVCYAHCLEQKYNSFFVQIS